MERVGGKKGREWRLAKRGRRCEKGRGGDRGWREDLKEVGGEHKTR